MPRRYLTNDVKLAAFFLSLLTSASLMSAAKSISVVLVIAVLDAGIEIQTPDSLKELSRRSVRETTPSRKPSAPYCRRHQIDEFFACCPALPKPLVHLVLSAGKALAVTAKLIWELVKAVGFRV